VAEIETRSGERPAADLNWRRAPQTGSHQAEIDIRVPKMDVGVPEFDSRVPVISLHAPQN